MQTNLPAVLLETSQGRRADSILRSCVHCGFCTATCPTYQLLGDELDGPRGRIYQIKQVLEGASPGRTVQMHLDRCLTCRSCETTCPSGVRYAELLEIGRHEVERRIGRPAGEKILRSLLRKVLPYPERFSLLLIPGRLLRPLLPAVIKRKIPAVARRLAWSAAVHDKKILVLDGCVQSVVTPDVNALASQVFDRLGYQLIRAQKAGCCGAVSTHLSAEEEGKRFVRNNIDAWWPYIEQGVEAIVATASGCGLMIHEYGQLLADDPVYAEKAKMVSALFRDPAQLLAEADLSALKPEDTSRTVAFHAPCTLQHGLKQAGVVESILRRAGYRLVEVNDAHLCCGSAGTYSILQSKISAQLLDNKLNNLQARTPDLIATANIGCQMHLQSGTQTPVVHWLSLLL
jgi:glycolate oxidase iron-sulfur subunit